ncbi:MAG: four helix bundle protein [Sphingobacteriales bacterium]|jgi:four helix bundle protein|nr:four helix bundle protein [Sphingobacteriales bacterium]
MTENIIKTKSFKFAIDIVNTYKSIIENKKEYELSKQLLRSGTSIGANIREGLNAQSLKDFIHKFSIAQKETDESLYWLELLKETNYITSDQFEKMNEKCLEIMKIISKIIVTSKNKS